MQGARAVFPLSRLRERAGVGHAGSPSRKLPSAAFGTPDQVRGKPFSSKREKEQRLSLNK
jgi:hypothetical protein